jgi:hypothetical protein
MPVPAVRRQRDGKEVLDAWIKSVEAQDPSRCGKLGCPDDVELQHVGVSGARVQPLHVQLVAMVRGVRRGLHVDANVGMHRVEPVQLRANRFAFSADGAAGEGEDVRIRPGAADQEEQRPKPNSQLPNPNDCASALVSHRLEWCPELASCTSKRFVAGSADDLL